MTGVISWNGIRSDQFGVRIEKYPSRTKPARKVSVYSVPGRSGDIIMPQDAWENVEQKYDLFIGDGEQHSATELFDQVASWLCGPSGYCELWDDFDPDHYRLAYVKDPFSLEPIGLGQDGRSTITFVCKPQRFLLSGKSTVNFTSAGVLFNETAFKARPLIFVGGNGEFGTVTIGETVFTLTQYPSSGLCIDCENMVCKDVNGNKVLTVTSSTSEYAVLNPGENAIGFTNSVTSLAITPNWFEI